MIEILSAVLGAENPAVNLPLVERLAGSLQGQVDSGHFFIALGIAALGGLLTSQTPCVYPLIPVTVRYFGGAGDESRRQSIKLAFVYVGGMVLLYTVLGTLFASFNLVFGSFLANFWVLCALALMCFLMALSTLDLFSVALPQALQQRLNQVGGRSVPGAFLMGLVSGLIAAPCTGPILLVILTVIAATGDMVFGFFLMLSFALGLGLPFLLLALFADAVQRLMSGGRLIRLAKGILAGAMFAVSMYFISIAFPGVLDGLHAWAQTLGLVSAVLTAGFGLGLLLKPRLDVLKFALAGSLASSAVFLLLVEAPVAQEIKWMTEHDTALEFAKERGQPVMVDFTADWCVACKEIERLTYVDSGVLADLERFVSLKIDATDVTDDVDKLFQKYKVKGLPTIVFIDSTGKLLEVPRVTGFVEAARFQKLLSEVK